jgi:PPOX class probable F420-dependent enzyme
MHDTIAADLSKNRAVRESSCLQRARRSHMLDPGGVATQLRRRRPAIMFRMRGKEMTAVPESHRDIFDKRAFAHFATVGANGEPQVTPVWVEYDGEYVLINSARGRKKDLNLRQHPQVAISIQDPENPYRYLGLQGEVAEITEEGAAAHINKLSNKYTGHDYPPLPEGQVRVIYKITPTRVWTMG